MKAIIFSLLILVSLLVGGQLAHLAPYHLYDHILSNGLENDYYTLKNPQTNLLRGNRYNNEKMVMVVSDDDTLWEEFHFQDYKLVLPLEHPQIISIPKISFESFGVSLGLSFLDQRKKVLAELSILSNTPMNLNLLDQKIFNLPIFKNYIRSKSHTDVWRDIFEKELMLPKFDKADILFSYDNITGLSYKELVYRLYILSLRSKLFEKNIATFSFDKKTNFGIVELKDDKGFGTQVIYVPVKGRVAKLQIRYKRETVVAESIRKRIYDSIEFIERSKDSSLSIYARHKLLPFEKRISGVGLIYMFSAWSHNIEEKSFLREMIQFLERGKDTIFYLTPLYQFAYKKFGTTFSSKDEKLLEKQKALLERKTREELEKELIREKKRDFVDEDGEFLNEDAKVKFFLQKGKDSTTRGDDDVLTVD